MKIIEVKDLTKKYREHTAVDGISVDVEEGEMFAFLGENGAGKSTTINMLRRLQDRLLSAVMSSEKMMMRSAS